MKLAAYQKKIRRWQKSFPQATNKAIKKMMNDVKEEVKQEYSGAKINIRTGKTRKAIASKFTPSKLTAKVFVKPIFAFVARFIERGTRYMRSRPVFTPLQKKYTPKTSHEILKNLIREYRRG